MKPSIAAAALLWAATAQAAELKVLTAGAFKSVLVALAPAFEAKSGHRLVIENDTAGALQKRIAGGEAFDVVVVTPGAAEALAKAGHVVPEVTWPLAKVAIGVAVRRGTPLPDVSTVPAFQAALRGARKVATIDPAAGGSSGIYLWQWFEKAGLAAELKPKAVLVPGGLVAERVVSGEADLAIHQISEILAMPGAQLVGPIPAAIQNWTVYAGTISPRTKHAEAALALLVHLAGPAAAEVLQAKGMEAP